MSPPKETVTSEVVAGKPGQKLPQKRKETDGQDPDGQALKPFVGGQGEGFKSHTSYTRNNPLGQKQSLAGTPEATGKTDSPFGRYQTGLRSGAKAGGRSGREGKDAAAVGVGKRSETPPVISSAPPLILQGDGESVAHLLNQVRPTDVAPFLNGRTEQDLTMGGLRDALAAMFQMQALGERVERERRLRTRAVELQSSTAAEHRAAKDRAIAMEEKAREMERRAAAAEERAKDAEIKHDLAWKRVRFLSKSQKSAGGALPFDEGAAPPLEPLPASLPKEGVRGGSERYLQKEVDAIVDGAEKIFQRSNSWKEGFERGQWEGFLAGQKKGFLDGRKKGYAEGIKNLEESISSLQISHQAKLKEQLNHSGHDFAYQALIMENADYKNGWSQVLKIAGVKKGSPKFDLYVNSLPNPNHPEFLQK